MAGRGVAESFTSKDEPPTLSHHDIYFRLGGGPPKAHLGVLASVAERLNDLPEHRGFEDGPAQGPRGSVLRVLEAGQVAEGAHVGKIYLGRFD